VTYKEKIYKNFRDGDQEVPKDPHEVYFNVLNLVVLDVIVFKLTHVLINIFE